MSQDGDHFHFTSQLKSFYELPIDLCCVIDVSDQKITYANLAFANILGWKSDELLKKLITEFIQPEDIKSIEKIFSKITLGLDSFNFETQFRTKNNLFRWIAWRAHTNENNKMLFMIGRDITHYKQNEKKLSEQANLDQLTGIFDRQTMLLLLAKELDAATRYHFPTAILIIDIDHFKACNEKLGYQKGDEYLKLVAITLKSCLRRKTDILARFGNDEFIVMLTHNDSEKALHVAKYLSANIKKLALSSEAGGIKNNMTVSIGISATTGNENKPVLEKTIIDTANTALAIAKKNSGNQIHFLEIPVNF
ncbi:MAG: diguanylate cyclase with PAS/PAC sensor [uncultured bacterium]|nr:MAG: diguanylate cyclase with PAS/PAC sensor [uncultured bacterium]